ncbi:MAG: hypothetical protein NVSMB25_14560 [Thermoleophilaceae bacterium]
MASQRFHIRFEPTPQPLRVIPSGELDLATVPELHERLLELERARTPTVLDLGELEFMDSSGLRLIVETAKTADRVGWELTLLRPRGLVEKLFQMTDVAAQLRFAER